MLSTTLQISSVINTNDQEKGWVENNRTDTKSHLNYDMPTERMHFTQCIQTQKFRQEEWRKGGRTSNWSVQNFFHKTFLPIGEINIIMWEAYIDIKSMRRWLTKGSMSCQHFLRIIVIQYYRTWELPTIFPHDSKYLKYFREEHYKTNYSCMLNDQMRS